MYNAPFPPTIVSFVAVAALEVVAIVAVVIDFAQINGSIICHHEQQFHRMPEGNQRVQYGIIPRHIRQEQSLVFSSSLLAHIMETAVLLLPLPIPFHPPFPVNALPQAMLQSGGIVDGNQPIVTAHVGHVPAQPSGCLVHFGSLPRQGSDVTAEEQVGRGHARLCSGREE